VKKRDAWDAEKGARDGTGSSTLTTSKEGEKRAAKVRRTGVSDVKLSHQMDSEGDGQIMEGTLV